jgi:hypothetical protein
MYHLPPFPLKKLNLTNNVGANHEVRGEIISTNGCPQPITQADLYLHIWYLLPDGDNWVFPQRRFTANNFYAGYDKLVVGTNIELVQGLSVAKTKLSPENSFVFTWKEVASLDRVPYINAHRITQSDLDPNDPTGYREITVKKVYKITGRQVAETPNQFPEWQIDFAPVVLIEFFGTETQKQFPPLHSQCIPVLPG